jgi:leader peptidase (prepilin peptidase)/N-methyltransferase
MWIAVAAVGGLLAGSFFNVVIARLPAGESLAHPGSRCPH